MTADGWMWRTAPLLALCLGCATTAGRVGASTTESATEEFRKQVREMPEEEQGVLGERAAAGAVRGALDELSTPERQAQLEEAIERAVTRALRAAAYGQARDQTAGIGGSGGGATDNAELRSLMEVLGRQLSKGIVSGSASELQRALGPDGRGPLADTFAASSQRLAASTVTAAQSELLSLSADCKGLEPFACAKRQVHELGAAATAGALSGVRWWLMLAAFVVGFMVNAALRDASRSAGLVIRRWRRRRPA